MHSNRTANMVAIGSVPIGYSRSFFTRSLNLTRSNFLFIKTDVNCAFLTDQIQKQMTLFTNYHKRFYSG